MYQFARASVRPCAAVQACVPGSERACLCVRACAWVYEDGERRAGVHTKMDDLAGMKEVEAARNVQSDTARHACHGNGLSIGPHPASPAPPSLGSPAAIPPS